MKNARPAAILLIVATAVCIVATMFVRSSMRKKAHIDIDTSTYITRGIDISGHNGDINFDDVVSDGYEFVFIKASEGADWRDNNFESNYRNAVNAGLKVGVYHFFRFDVEAWQQSVNLLSTIGQRPLDLPVAVDVEEWGNVKEYSTDNVIKNLRTFINLVRRQGREVIIYTNKKGYSKFIRNNFDDAMLWICSFTDPALAENSRWTFWQHSHCGRVNGIGGDVDLCTFNTPLHGDFNQWISTSPSIAKINI